MAVCCTPWPLSLPQPANCLTHQMSATLLCSCQTGPWQSARAAFSEAGSITWSSEGTSDCSLAKNKLKQRPTAMLGQNAYRLLPLNSLCSLSLLHLIILRACWYAWLLNLNSLLSSMYFVRKISLAWKLKSESLFSTPRSWEEFHRSVIGTEALGNLNEVIWSFFRYRAWELLPKEGSRSLYSKECSQLRKGKQRWCFRIWPRLRRSSPTDSWTCYSYWTGCPEKFVDAPSLETFKTG